MARRHRCAPRSGLCLPCGLPLEAFQARVGLSPRGFRADARHSGRDRQRERDTALAIRRPRSGAFLISSPGSAWSAHGQQSEGVQICRSRAWNLVRTPTSGLEGRWASVRRDGHGSPRCGREKGRPLLAVGRVLGLDTCQASAALSPCSFRDDARNPRHPLLERK